METADAMAFMASAGLNAGIHLFIVANRLSDQNQTDLRRMDSKLEKVLGTKVRRSIWANFIRLRCTLIVLKQQKECMRWQNCSLVRIQDLPTLRGRRKTQTKVLRVVLKKFKATKKDL